MASADFLVNIKKQIVNIGAKIYYEYQNPETNEFLFLDITYFVSNVTSIRYDQQSLIVGAPTLTLINSELLPLEFYNRKAISRRVKIFFSANGYLNLVFEGRISDISFTENQVEVVCKDIFYDLLNKALGNKTKALTNKNKVIDLQHWHIDNVIGLKWLPYLAYDNETNIKNAGYIVKAILMGLAKGNDDITEETSAEKEANLSTFVDATLLSIWTGAIAEYQLGIHLKGISIKDVLTKIAELTNSFIWISNSAEDDPMEQTMVLNFVKNYDSYSVLPAPTYTLDKTNIIDITFLYETDPLINDVTVGWGRTETEKREAGPPEKVDYSYSWTYSSLGDETEERIVERTKDLDSNYVNLFTNNTAEYQDESVWHDTEVSATHFADTVLAFMSFPRRKVEIKTTLEGLTCGVGSVVRVNYPLYGLNNDFRINRIEFDMMSGTVNLTAIEGYRDVPFNLWSHIYEIDSHSDYPQAHDWILSKATKNYNILQQYINPDGTTDYTCSNICPTNVVGGALTTDEAKNKTVFTLKDFRWLNGWFLGNINGESAWNGPAAGGNGDNLSVVTYDSTYAYRKYQSALSLNVAGHSSGYFEVGMLRAGSTNDGFIPPGATTFSYETFGGVSWLSFDNYSLTLTNELFNEKAGVTYLVDVLAVINILGETYRTICTITPAPPSGNGFTININYKEVIPFYEEFKMTNFIGSNIKTITFKNNMWYVIPYYTNPEVLIDFGAFFNPIISLNPAGAYIEKMNLVTNELESKTLSLISVPFYEKTFTRLPNNDTKGAIEIVLGIGILPTGYAGGPVAEYPFVIQYGNSKGLFSYDITDTILTDSTNKTVTMSIDCSDNTNTMTIYVDKILFTGPVTVYPTAFNEVYNIFRFGWAPNVVCTHQTDAELRYVEVTSVKLNMQDIWDPSKEIIE